MDTLFAAQEEEVASLLTLTLIEGIGARRATSLCKYFGSATRAMEASSSELIRIPGFGKGVADQFSRGRAEAQRAAEQQLKMVGEDMFIVALFDPEFPPHLAAIYDPPALLFGWGDKSILCTERKLAVIGTRKITDYGRRCTIDICEELVKENVTIVSGFAAGIDTAAHHAAVDAGGKTIGVLGSGIDVIYPASNKNFAKKIVVAGSGLLLSELPFGTPPDARHFPWRNRIVSGLSHGVIVVESDTKGGSMITASIALDQDREIFAVPGDLSRPTSAGPNLLIHESRARLIRSGRDAMIELKWVSSVAKNKKKLDRTSLTLFESRIVDILEAAGEPLQVDDLAERVSSEVPELLVQLLNLEFKDVVRQMAGKQFMLL